MRAIAAISVVVLLAGCGGAVENISASDAGSDAGLDAGTNADGGPTCTVARCETNSGCRGTASCGSDNACHYTNAPSAGSACGAADAGTICKDDACISAVCGDGLVTAPEECDDGTNDGTHGCGRDCRWTCVQGDNARSCAPADSCAGQGTCNADHTCTPGAHLPDGTACGTGGHCSGGVCQAAGAKCGNGVVDPGEDCDFGNLNGPGSGCEVSCKFSCSGNSCGAGDACSGGLTCSAVSVAGHTGQKCLAGSNEADGTACGPNGSGEVCYHGVCGPPPPNANCGNGHLDPGEECDFGAANGPGSGCERDCKFSCHAASDCAAGDPCKGTNTCTQFTGSAGTGQKCEYQNPPAACSTCGAGGVCRLGVCRTSVCGDGCIDTSRGETCEPPGQGLCDAQCHSTPACGNGIREPGEQCDDGNLTNLDGCDASCKLEQDHRANALKLQMPPSATDSFCTANAIGSAIVNGTAQNDLQGALDTQVKQGQVTVGFKISGLSDLTGAGNQTVKLGAVSGSPYSAPSGVTYDGTADKDWWYVADPSNIDGSRTPTASLDGSLSGAVLSAGPGRLTLKLALGGPPAPMSMSNVRVRANIGRSSAPLQSATGQTPGHAASEHLDPAITSFDAMSNGELCGNVSAASLAAIPLPAALEQAGCDEGYKVANGNTLLDVIVGGCTVFFGLTTALDATPTADQVDPSAPAVGAGGRYTFVVSGNKVSGCKDKNGTTVDLTRCEAAAAYSVFFQFTTDRVILK